MHGRWVAAGSLLALVGVALGAFGAHALKASLSPASMEIFRTATMYHLVHAVGIVLAASMWRGGPSGRPIATACALMFTGTLCFSGSLYLLAITGVSALGAVAPVGGLGFMLGWGFLAYGAILSSRKPDAR